MEVNQKHNHQMEIGDLINHAINNAIARRGSEEALLALPDEETEKVMGGLIKSEIAVAGFRPINPHPPVKPIDPHSPVTPIKPPIIVGLIALPDSSGELA